MKLHNKSILNLLILLLFVSFISGCSDSDDDDSDDDDSSAATVVPAINPAFDSVSSVMMSDSPGGTYTEVSYTYDDATEKVTLAEDVIGSGGNYLKITGEATVDGAAGDYTVMTYVANNKTSIAANELTTLAVAMVVNDASIDDFDAAIDKLVDDGGFNVPNDIIMPMTEAQRADVPNLQETLKELSRKFDFKTDDIVLADLADVSAPNMNQVAWGALLYDNWMKAPGEMPVGAAPVDHSMHKVGKVTARSEHGMDHPMPMNLSLMLMGEGNTETHLEDTSGAEHEMFGRFARCKECHGWDQMGDMGSHMNRERENKTLVNPNNNSDTGDFVKRPKSIDGTDLTDNTEVYTMMNIVPATGSGIKYANVDPDSGDHLMDTTVAALATSWNAAVNEEDAGVRFSDKHPDFTRTAAADATDSTNPYEGAVNDVVPSHDQIMALTAFLNYDGGKIDSIMSFNATSGEYELVDPGHTEHGEEYYADYCFRCHGAPNTSNPNPLMGEGGNLMGYLSNDDDSLNQVHFSGVFHVARWGKAGAGMTRDRIGYPSAHDVAGLMAYVKAYQAGDAALTAATAKGNTGVGDATEGETFYYNKCAGCHSASATSLTASDSADTDDSGEDKSYRCVNAVTFEVEAVGDDGTCGDNHTIPNLKFTHFAMTPDLSDISSIMDNVNNEKNLTPQEINDLAAFFSGLSASE